MVETEGIISRVAFRDQKIRVNLGTSPTGIASSVAHIASARHRALTVVSWRRRTRWMHVQYRTISGEICISGFCSPTKRHTHTYRLQRE